MESPEELNLLLDTHVWLWALLDPDRLGKRAAHALADPENQLWLSPLSAWEALLLCESGRLLLGNDPIAWLLHAQSALPVRDAALTREVAMVSRTLDLPQQDPADRFIAATAKVLELALVTADRQLLDCGEYEVLAAR